MDRIVSASGKIGDDIVRIVVYTNEDIEAEEYFKKYEFLIIESMDVVEFHTAFLPKAKLK